MQMQISRTTGMVWTRILHLIFIIRLTSQRITRTSSRDYQINPTPTNNHRSSQPDPIPLFLSLLIPPSSSTTRPLRTSFTPGPHSQFPNFQNPHLPHPPYILSSPPTPLPSPSYIYPLQRPQQPHTRLRSYIPSLTFFGLPLLRRKVFA